MQNGEQLLKSNINIMKKNIKIKVLILIIVSSISLILIGSLISYQIAKSKYSGLDYYFYLCYLIVCTILISSSLSLLVSIVGIIYAKNKGLIEITKGFKLSLIFSSILCLISLYLYFEGYFEHVAN